MENISPLEKLGKKIKVLIIDDSAFIRNVLTTHLGKDKMIEVVGSAPDPFIGRDMIVELKPDVLILDLQLPKMDGLTFLKKLIKHYPLPVIIFSGLTANNCQLAVKALQEGAVEVMNKPSSKDMLTELPVQLIDKIKAAAWFGQKGQRNKYFAKKKFSVEPIKLNKTSNTVVVIGSSTGGTQALERLLTAFPANCPPIVIVQHMPEHFTKSFAERLDELCAFEVKEAENGDLLKPGRAIIGKGNYHLTLRHTPQGYCVLLKEGPLVSRHRPSVDILFKSAAKEVGKGSVGVILTGMGADGAEGMKILHDTGARTIAQDEESCVIFGMPKEAIARGGIDYVVNLKDIPEKIAELV